MELRKGSWGTVALTVSGIYVRSVSEWDSMWKEGRCRCKYLVKMKSHGRMGGLLIQDS